MADEEDDDDMRQQQKPRLHWNGKRNIRFARRLLWRRYGRTNEKKTQISIAPPPNASHNRCLVLAHWFQMRAHEVLSLIAWLARALIHSHFRQHTRYSSFAPLAFALTPTLSLSISPSVLTYPSPNRLISMCRFYVTIQTVPGGCLTCTRRC